MESAPALVIMLTTLPALIGAVVVAANAKRINAASRARREARSAVKVASK
ncbi:hypothetical protein V2S04_07020 [Microbacterium sp. OR21]